MVLEVEYELAGERPRCCLSAITSYEGSSTGYWAYAPQPLEPGRHVLRETVSMNSEGSPDFYWSDGLELDLEVPPAAPYHLSFQKLWCRRPGGCDAREFEVLGRAPLGQRLVSVHPNVRRKAFAELEPLDQASRRELLPDVLRLARTGTLREQENALEILERFRFADGPVLDALCELTSGTTQPVPRLATGVLARLATLDHVGAMQALRRAASADDETTRLAAKSGLERLAALDRAHP